ARGNGLAEGGPAGCERVDGDLSGRDSTRGEDEHNRRREDELLHGPRIAQLRCPSGTPPEPLENRHGYRRESRETNACLTACVLSAIETRGRNSYRRVWNRRGWRDVRRARCMCEGRRRSAAGRD